MSLSPGTRIGPYEILAPLGRGGMGEVWRARDTKLRREVAIKALPAELAAAPERRARLEREAHLLASLNHPNVAAIYGLEETDAAVYLVLELVEGETLDQRLAAGPLPISECVSVASQIAAGLEAAHEAGVIHRDLKPSNVKIRPDGSVKVLDLGLARVAAPAGAPPDSSLSPTVTSGGTGAGVILGTASYMSPEQARGQALDRRTDVFSFGCVLYECLTGKQAFCGETVSDTLVAILTQEPDWNALPASTPPRLADLTRRCLRKERKQRVHDIGDARLEIEEALRDPAAPAVPSATARRTWLWGAGGALVGGAIAAALVLSQRRPAPAAPSVRAVLPLPAGAELLSSSGDASLAVSPDGRTVVFRARGVRGGLLYRRALEGPRAEPIQGTEGGLAPFFSPDGQWLGFFTVDELKKVPLAGGAAVSLTSVPPVTAGGSWAPDGRIVYTATYNSPLFVIPETGGQAKALIALDASRGDHAHLYPQVLPSGQAILFTLRLGRDFLDLAHSSIAVLDTKTGRSKIVLEGASYARYGGGRLVFVRGSSVFMAPFDAARLEVVGPAVPLSEGMAAEPERGFAQFDLSHGGTLVFLEGPPARVPTTSVLALDRSGKETVLPVPEGNYSAVRLSPDGGRLALSRSVGMGGSVVVYDRQRRILTTLTTEPGSYFCPIWSPDGKRIAMSRFGSRQPELCVKSADGNGEMQTLTKPTDAEFPNAWSSDGKTIAYTVTYLADRSPTRKLLTSDVWMLPLDDANPPRPWLETPFRETAPAFSPDGKWIAYVSDESGAPEISVRPYPGPGSKIKISTDSGIEPAWTRGGRELVYRTGSQWEKFMVVDIQTASGLTASTPRLLFSAALKVGGREDDFRDYEISRDGNEFIALRTVRADEPNRQLTVVTNWAASAAR